LSAPKIINVRQSRGSSRAADLSAASELGPDGC
jgi:hypothetical protein